MARRPVLLTLSVVFVYFFKNCDLTTAKSNPDDIQLHKETVRVDLYYESLCPDCIAEYPQLPPLVEKLDSRVDLHTYPFGNAKMTREENGQITVKCQHGEHECYGNKLHACAIDLLQNQAAYVNYNACLMTSNSDDAAADSCGKSQGVDSASIKTCAKGDKGFQLLVHYGEESQKVSYPGVPYVLVNGSPMPDNQTIWDAVCGALSMEQKPKQCQNVDVYQTFQIN